MNQNNSTILLALGDGDNGINYSLQGPVNLTGSTLTFVLNFDSGAEASDKAVIFKAWNNNTGQGNYWNCDTYWFVAGQDTTYSCSTLTASATDSETAAVNLSFGAKAGTVTIKSATLQLAQ